MTHLLSLPVSHHVARREAGLSLRRAEGAADTWNVLVTEVLQPAKDRFRAGERLSTADLAAIVDLAGRPLADIGPPLMEADARGPTRARPKGEQHEIRAVTRMGYDRRSHGLYGLASVRIHATRKKVEVDYDMLGLDVTGHLLERTIQRDLASWTGRFREVEQALLDVAGLAVAWRYALASKQVGTNRIAAPLGDGLMLGELAPSRVGVISQRVTVGKVGTFTRDMGRSPFHVPLYADAPDLRYLRAAFATAVGGDALTIRQIDLRDALARFRETHAPALARIGRSAVFRQSELSPVEGFDALEPDVMRLAGELGKLLRVHGHDEALNHGYEGPAADPAPSGPRR